MKFKLSRQVFSKEIRKVISREIRKQKMSIPKLNSQEMKELAEASRLIEKWGIPKYLVLKKLKHNLGYGIFLHPHAMPIKKGRVIASYGGEVSLIAQNQSDDGSYAFTPIEKIQLSKEEQHFFDKKCRYHPKRLYALKIDALKKGNFTRYINHSENPNIIAYTLAVPPNSHGLIPSLVEIVYFAKKTIYPGEQLLVSYEDEEKSYWGASAIAPFPMTPKTFQLDSSLKFKGFSKKSKLVTNS